MKVLVLVLLNMGQISAGDLYRFSLICFKAIVNLFSYEKSDLISA